MVVPVSKVVVPGLAPHLRRRKRVSGPAVERDFTIASPKMKIALPAQPELHGGVDLFWGSRDPAFISDQRTAQDPQNIPTRS